MSFIKSDVMFLKKDIAIKITLLLQLKQKNMLIFSIPKIGSFLKSFLVNNKVPLHVVSIFKGVKCY